MLSGRVRSIYRRGEAAWEEYRVGVGPLVRHERYRNAAWVAMAGRDGG
jgi:hypothetical protein